MRVSFFTSIFRQAVIGMALVVVSLPVLFLAHRAMDLGKPPVFGLVLLALTVVISMALAGAIGAAVARAKGDLVVAGVLGLVLGLVVCAVVAPIYGGIILDNITRQATVTVAGTVIGQDPETFAREKAVQAGKQTLSAAREGRLRAELDGLRDKARNATKPAARKQAADRAQQIVKELAANGQATGVSLLKSGVAQLSAFTLLVWALVRATNWRGVGMSQSQTIKIIFTFALLPAKNSTKIFAPKFGFELS